MRLGAARCLVALVFWQLSTTPVWACVIPRDVAGERARWQKVEGEYRQIRSFDVSKGHRNETSWAYKGDGEWEESGPIEIRWTHTWRFGQIIVPESSPIETYHRTSDLETTCGEAEGPEIDGRGEFYIQINPKDGRYYIHDWEPAEPEGSARK